MRIGIDIDGVLTDLEQWQLDYASKYYYEEYGKEIQNIAGYDTSDIFKVNRKIDDEFWKKVFIEYSINVEMRRFANEVIQKLKQERNEIYIITARGGDFLSQLEPKLTKEENEEIVKEWLQKNHIIYDKIVFSPEDKLDVCIENKIDLMIEDKPENVINISTKIPVLCFSAEYNKNCKGKNIIHCYSWYDIYSKIKNSKYI